MRFELDGNEVYASTGGREHKDGQPWLIFLHGAGSSHLVWSQQSRSFAYAGYNVLALDFPGHNLSGGEPLKSVDEQAAWVLGVMNHLGVEKATLVGHSLGGLICLEMEHLAPGRIEKIAFVATSYRVPVGEPLLDNADNREQLAKNAMTAWGLGPEAHHFENTVPGFSHIGFGLRTMDLNPEGAVAADLHACNNYDSGEAKAAKVRCPTLCVFGGKDKMTHIKSGMKLAEALPDNTLHILKESGHTIPGERPHELNVFLREFLKG